MKDKLKHFLDETFAPYGDFPSRADVTQELLVNLQEKYDELRKLGRSEDEAYRATIDSFGDVAEIMDQVPHGESEQSENRSDSKASTKAKKRAKASRSPFSCTTLRQADLSDSDLSGRDFSLQRADGRFLRSIGPSRCEVQGVRSQRRVVR